MLSKKALITGITGQDGSYLAELLLSKGYEVHGIVRRSSTLNRSRIDHIHSNEDDENSKLHLHYGDLTDTEQISNIIYNISPDEVYNLGAQSHVRVSFDTPEYTSNVVGLGVARLLETIRRTQKDIRFYQASSSEMFGAALPPQNEETQFVPRSPYACAKLYAYWMVRNYREGYGILASNGILFNHESPRRGETFVTRKITMNIASIVAKEKTHMTLGNLDAKRDWGFSPEYVEAMWEMLQQKNADDYVIGTGETHSVREFLDKALEYVDLNIDNVVKTDPKYFRPTEVNVLAADCTKARKAFNWKPKIKFDDLVKIMIDADFRKIGLEPLGEGDEIISKKFGEKWWNSD